MFLTFNSKSSQIARTFLRLFSKTFGLAYSPLNSATLSCSSEVTLVVILYHVKKDAWSKIRYKFLIRYVKGIAICMRQLMKSMKTCLLFLYKFYINDKLIFDIFHEKNATFYELNRHIWAHQKYHFMSFNSQILCLIYYQVF